MVNKFCVIAYTGCFDIDAGVPLDKTQSVVTNINVIVKYEEIFKESQA